MPALYVKYLPGELLWHNPENCDERESPDVHTMVREKGYLAVLMFLVLSVVFEWYQV